MAIQCNPILTDKDYVKYRYDLILWFEETGHIHNKPYTDAKWGGWATIGIGFKITNNFDLIFEKLGFDDTSIEEGFKNRIMALFYDKNGKEKTFTKASMIALNKALDSEMLNRYKYYAKLGDTTKLKEFKLSNTVVEELFPLAAEKYEKLLSGFLGEGSNMFSVIPRSFERIALLSRAYNGVLLGTYTQGPKKGQYIFGELRDALLDGNRAEAWYWMRYSGYKAKVNGKLVEWTGLVKRRFAEAEFFGLYKDSNNINLTEAKMVYRMLQEHRSDIIRKEEDYGVAFDGVTLGTKKIQYGTTNPTYLTPLQAANKEYGQILSTYLQDQKVDTLETSLNPAMGKILDWLRAECPIAIQNYGSIEFIKSFNILLDPSSNGSNGTTLNARYSMNNVELIIENILIGEGGNDTLIGGKGNDLLLGGEGDDIYIYNTGDGYDTIYDSDKKGRIIINNDYGKPQGLGNMYKKEGYTDVWTDGSGKIQITHHSPWQIVLEDGGTITLGEDFQSGDFGISLIDVPDNPTTSLTITGDLAPIDFDPDTPGVQVHYDALGNVITDPNTPEAGRADTLYDSAGNDLIIGGGGNDQIRADNGGDDWLKGGSGSDGIVAGSGKDILEGGSGADLLFGGTYDDKLFAGDMGEMSDLVEAGETAVGMTGQGDLLSGGEGNDFLYGSDNSDALFGGAGSDLLVGGGGDDVILSAGDATGALFDWSYVIETSPNPGGGTSYSPVLTNVAYQSVLLEDTGSDTIYCNSGSDSFFNCIHQKAVMFLVTLLAVTITSTAIGMAGSAQKQKACYRLTSGKDSKMCRLFLHNLNHLCDLPNACEVPIHPSLAKYFSVPKWEIVNVEDHLDIVAAYIRIRAPRMANCDTECMVRKREQEWQEYKPELLKRIKDGRISLVRSRINIRHDDESRMAYRLVDNVCSPDNDYENYKIARRPGLMIVDEKTGKPDKYYSTTPLSNSVLLYEGDAYLIDLDFLHYFPTIYNYARVECNYIREGNKGGQR